MNSPRVLMASMPALCATTAGRMVGRRTDAASVHTRTRCHSFRPLASPSTCAMVEPLKCRSEWLTTKALGQRGYTIVGMITCRWTMLSGSESSPAGILEGFVLPLCSKVQLKFRTRSSSGGLPGTSRNRHCAIRRRDAKRPFPRVARAPVAPFNG